MDFKKTVAMCVVTVSAMSAVATADDIGGGKPILDPHAAPAEESGTSESSTDSFFNDLLEIFELGSGD